MDQIVKVSGKCMAMAPEVAPSSGTKTVSNSNHRSIRPSRMLLIVTLLWLAIYIVAPIQPNVNDPLPALTFLSLGIFAIWTGAAIGERVALKLPHRNRTTFRRWTRTYWIALSLGCIGIALRAFDWLVLRGLTFGASTFQNRELLETGSGSIVAVLSLTLAPMVLAAFMLRTDLNAKGVKIGTRLDILAGMAYPLLNILVGSRSPALFFAFVFAVTFVMSQRRLRIRSIVALGIVGIGLVGVASMMLFDRLQDMGTSYFTVARFSGYTFTVPLSEAFIEFLAQADEGSAKLAFLFAHYTQYALHGAFEFVLIYGNYSGDHTLGAYQAFFPIKMLSRIFSFTFEAESITQGLPRIGVFDTFFGAAYVDFGYMALPFGALFGFASGVIWQVSTRSDPFLKPLHIGLLYIIALVPFVNGFLFSGGLLMLTSFLAFKTVSMIRL